MIDCDDLLDRMPDVLAGRATWIGAEAEHLAGCPECAGAWRVTASGAGLARGVGVDLDRVAATVVRRLATEPVPVRRLPWRSLAVGMAAAASVAIAVLAPGREGGGAPVPAAAALLPELDVLSESELERLLEVVGGGDELEAGAQPRLDDLTADELERVLRAMEG